MISMTKKTAVMTKKETPKASTSGKPATTGHDPVGKKVGATKTTHGSTYDFRKGSQAKKPAPQASQTAKDKVASRMSRAEAKRAKMSEKKRLAAEKRAAHVKARAEKKKALFEAKKAKG